MMWDGPPSLSTEHTGYDYDGLSSSEGNLDRDARPGQGIGDERQHQRWMGGGGGLPDLGERERVD